MRAQQMMVRVLAMTAVGGAAVGAAQRRAESRAAGRFYQARLEATEPRPIGAGYGGAPVFWHGSEWIESLHSASLDAIRDVLPSDDLHPVRLPNGRAVVYAAATQYDDITANGVDGLAALPYGEVWVAVAVTRRPAPPLVPLIAPAATGLSAGWFVLHLPVTTMVARDVGRIIWGLPKFMADMEFEDSIAMRRVHLAEGGRTILTLTARPSGRPAIGHESVLVYSVVDGQLTETTIPTYGLRQTRWGRGGGRLELGDHQVADELRDLDISPEPFMTRLAVSQRIALTIGRPIGTARPYVGYIGEDRDLGRYVVRYPNAAPIDRYAPFAATAGPVGPMAGMAPAAAAVTSEPELVEAAR